jgi:hypothetical protein
MVQRSDTAVPDESRDNAVFRQIAGFTIRETDDMPVDGELLK